jgi:hypothetical protein
MRPVDSVEVIGYLGIDFTYTRLVLYSIDFRITAMMNNISNGDLLTAWLPNIVFERCTVLYRTTYMKGLPISSAFPLLS